MDVVIAVFAIIGFLAVMYVLCVGLDTIWR